MNDSKRRLFALAGIRNEAPGVDVKDGTATIRLYDIIDGYGGPWGVSAKEFVAILDGLEDDVTDIALHINSPGGEVFEAVAILNALRDHDAKVTATVDGLAASAASVIACGADELVMAPNSEMMIHDAWGLCVGNAEDMAKMATDLDHMSDNIASVYAEKAGGDVAAWRAVMKAETWYSAEEAVAAGLADRVAEKKSTAKAEFDLSVFTYAGRAQAPAPPIAPPPAGDPAEIDAVSAARFRLLVASTRT